MAYIGRPLNAGNLAVQSGTGDGADTTPIATLDYSVGSSNSIGVYLDGVRQLAGTDFTAAGTTLTFTTAPANGVGIDVYFLGLELSIPTPADATVTSAKIVDGAILNADVNASAAIEGGKLNLNTGTGNAKLTSSSQATTTLILEQATAVATTPSSGVVLQLQRDDTTGRSAELSILSGNVGQAQINFGDAQDEDIGNIAYDNNTNGMSFKTNTSTALEIDSSQNVEVSAGNLVIGTAGKGIDFSVNSHAAGMTSEVLDSYEEGTWTASVTDGTTAMTPTVTGSYTKIGDLVYATAFLGLSGGGASGGAYIAGLPFTSKNDGRYSSITVGYTHHYDYMTAGHNILGHLPANSALISLYVADLAVGASGMTIAEFSSNGQLLFSIMYKAA